MAIIEFSQLAIKKEENEQKEEEEERGRHSIISPSR